MQNENDSEGAKSDKTKEEDKPQDQQLPTNLIDDDDKRSKDTTITENSPTEKITKNFRLTDDLFMNKLALEEVKVNEEEARIIMKTTMSMDLVKEEEFKYEQKERICHFYAHDMRCPDMEEFRRCSYQHDEDVKLARRMLESGSLTREERTQKMIQYFMDRYEEEDIIIYKKKLLRFWPERPSINQQANAEAKLQ